MVEVDEQVVVIDIHSQLEGLGGSIPPQQEMEEPPREVMHRIRVFLEDLR